MKEGLITNPQFDCHIHIVNHNFGIGINWPVNSNMVSEFGRHDNLVMFNL